MAGILKGRRLPVSAGSGRRDHHRRTRGTTFWRSVGFGERRDVRRQRAATPAVRRPAANDIGVAGRGRPADRSSGGLRRTDLLMRRRRRQTTSGVFRVATVFGPEPNDGSAAPAHGHRGTAVRATDLDDGRARTDTIYGRAAGNGRSYNRRDGTRQPVGAARATTLSGAAPATTGNRRAGPGDDLFVGGPRTATDLIRGRTFRQRLDSGAALAATESRRWLGNEMIGWRVGNDQG